VSGVHVTYFKACALTRKAARPKCRDTTLVRDLGQWVGLVHKLRQLARTEKLFDSRRDRLGVDEIVRHEVFSLSLAQTLFDGTLYTHQTCTELVLGQLAHTAHTAITQVIDVIDLAPAITQLNQHLDGFKNVFI